MNVKLEDLSQNIEQSVKLALEEDIGSGDITAQLIPAEKKDTAELITREDCIVCGQAWFNETFKQMGGVDSIQWLVKEGEHIKANTKLVRLKGNSRSLLTGERTALNFLQLLSGVATLAGQYAAALGDSDIKLLDTRKTIPGLRLAQKYAVSVGGCHNHRIGLWDAFLIKENHIAACGGIEQAVSQARKNEPGKKIEVEVETIEELKEAILAGADVAMLDNFDSGMLDQTNDIDLKNTRLEYSGDLSIENLFDVKNYKISYVSFGSLTKHIRAIDLSFRVIKFHS